MKVLLIYNNYAGNSNATRKLKEVQLLLKKAKIEYDLEIPAYPGNGAEIVSKAELSSYDGVIAAGGDGTLYEVANGLYNNTAKSKIPIGILPVGTGNAFARDMDLHVDQWQEAIKIIKNGKTRKVDAGLFTTEGEEYVYLNILGLGFVADVGETAHRLKLFGNFSYTLGVVYRTISLNPTPMTIIADDKTIETPALFVEVSNSRYTANFLMAPDAVLDDGLLDVTIAKPMGRIKLLKSFPKILTGDHIHMDEIMHFKAKKISIQAAKKKILTPDGELMGSTPVNIECLEKEFEIFWP